ncbi:hypothetical protein [Planotetraspora sp. GP83]|uniref:hypothetical protein n=1 Tax=Planotetraspora sp. GP83 TaxID=3156264 RepID=UPI003516A1CB
MRSGTDLARDHAADSRAAFITGLIRTLVVHPIAAAVLAVPSVIWVRYGWPVAVAVVTVPGSLLTGWAVADRASFAHWVGWRLLAFWRRFWTYRRHWQPVMVISGLGRHLQGRDYLPRLVRVDCDGWADRVDRARNGHGSRRRPSNDQSPGGETILDLGFLVGGA